VCLAAERDVPYEKKEAKKQGRAQPGNLAGRRIRDTRISEIPTGKTRQARKERVKGENVQTRKS